MVTGKGSSAGRLNRWRRHTSVSGSASRLRTVMPSPPTADAQSPARLGLVAATRHGIPAASNWLIAALRKTHCGPNSTSGNGWPDVGANPRPAIQPTSSAPKTCAAWIEPDEAREDRGQHGVGKILRETKAHGTSERGAAHGLDEIVIQREHASSDTQGHFPGHGQREAPSALSKQRHPDVLLKTLHLQADRGGRSSEAFRRLAITAEVVGDDQRA